MSTAVYQLTANPNLRWVDIKDKLDRPLGHMLEGRPIAESWHPLVIQHVLDDELPSGLVSDFPYMGGIPVLSGRAIRCLSDMLLPYGELLPLRAEFGGEYCVYNVTNVVDALDSERSEIERFATSGRVKRITHFVFRPEQVDQLIIFKLPQLRVPVFVTEPFRQRVEAHGLTGFVFEPLWP